MDDQTNSRLNQYIKINKADGSGTYIFKFPDDNGMGELKNSGDGNMDFSMAGSGVTHYSSSATIDVEKSGCFLTVGGASPITLTLPTASDASGYRFGFIRTQDVSSTVTIASQNSEDISIVDYVNGTISGTSISSAASQPVGSCVHLFSTGTEWVGCNLANGWSA